MDVVRQRFQCLYVLYELVTCVDGWNDLGTGSSGSERSLKYLFVVCIFEQAWDHTIWRSPFSRFPICMDADRPVVRYFQEESIRENPYRKSLAFDNPDFDECNVAVCRLHDSTVVLFLPDRMSTMGAVLVAAHTVGFSRTHASTRPSYTALLPVD